MNSYLVPFLLDEELDGIANELRVLLHDLLHASFLQVLGLVLLQVEGDLGAAADGFA